MPEIDFAGRCVMLMMWCKQVQGDVLVLYVYQLRKDANGVENVAVEKVSYRKNASS